MITTRKFTRLGRSVCRVVWRGFWNCLERRTSGLFSMGSIRVLGQSFNSKRRQVLFKIAGFHIGYNLFAPELLFYCMDFSQIWYRWKAIFEENPMPYVTKDGDYSLWIKSAITKIAPLRSFWRYWWLSNPDFSFLDIPSCLECSPSVWHWSGWDLGDFGAETSLSLVGFQGLSTFIVEWACRFEFLFVSSCWLWSHWILLAVTAGFS